MFNAEFIKKLKQTNVSVNAELTAVRTKELWKSASKEDKQAVLELSGVSGATVGRVCRSGSISAKLVVAIAQILGASPFFLTGEAEERGECTEQLLKEFLLKNKYQKLLAVQSPTKKGRKKAAAKRKSRAQKAAKAVEAAVSKPKPAAQKPDNASQELMDTITVDDMVVLLRAAMLRAKKGGAHAQLAEDLKKLLLS